MRTVVCDLFATITHFQRYLWSWIRLVLDILCVLFTKTRWCWTWATIDGNMTITLPSKYRALMPGSFDTDDFIEFYQPPIEVLQNLQTAYRDKGPVVPWSAENLEEVNVGDIDWHKYDPPASLRKTTNVTNQVLLDIVYSSIENVKAQIAEENRLKLEAAEREREAKEADDPSKPGKGKEPYLPIIIPDDKATVAVTNPSDLVSPRKSSVSQSDGASVPSVEKAEKRRRFALRRLFQRSRDSGESSAAGTAREALRKAYESSGPEGNADAVPKIESSIISRLSNWKSAPAEPVECVSCLDDFHPKEVIKVPCHNYCRDCFTRLITAAVQNEQQWPPKCCLNEIPFRTIHRYINSDLKHTFQERAKEWEIPISERIYCSQADCSLWVKPQQVDHNKNQGRCDNGHLTCSICRGANHDGGECPQDNDLHLTNLLAEEEGWKRCYRCNALVEHREACQHMTCRCGAEFCYVCCRVWRTCECTMEQLDQIKTTVQDRRNERRDKENAEAEELRLMLLEIEQFEQEEALKAELLRQEMERREEERRQAELDERVRQESIRRRDMEDKYKELRIMLNDLHDMQQALLQCAQDTTTQDIVAESKALKEELGKKQYAQRADLQALALTKSTDKEFNLRKDYQVRAVEEQKIEEAYYEKLKEFWKDKKDGDQEIEAAMLKLKQKMDHRQRSWEKWKDDQLKDSQRKLDNERVFREELMYSAEHRLNDKCAEKEAEDIRRSLAEKMWLHMVVIERERLMNEWEEQEVEGDADSIFAAESPDRNSVEVAA